MLSSCPCNRHVSKTDIHGHFSAPQHPSYPSGKGLAQRIAHHYRPCTEGTPVSTTITSRALIQFARHAKPSKILSWRHAGLSWSCSKHQSRHNKYMQILEKCSSHCINRRFTLARKSTILFISFTKTTLEDDIMYGVLINQQREEHPEIDLSGEQFETNATSSAWQRLRLWINSLLRLRHH